MPIWSKVNIFPIRVWSVGQMELGRNANVGPLELTESESSSPQDLHVIYVDIKLEDSLVQIKFISNKLHKKTIAFLPLNSTVMYINNMKDVAVALFF